MFSPKPYTLNPKPINPTPRTPNLQPLNEGLPRPSYVVSFSEYIVILYQKTITDPERNYIGALG